MRFCLFILLIVGASWPVNAQKPLVDAYVLGLIDDYDGRKVSKDTPQEETLIDKFHFTEGVLVTYLDSIITEANKRTYDKVHISVLKWEKPNCYFCTEFNRVLSPRLAQIVNESFVYKYTKPAKDAEEEKKLIGYLKPSLFKEPKEKMSFLAGAYARYGVKEGGVYKIRLINTASKFNQIVKELKALRCDIKDVQLAIEAPFLQEVSFLPTEDLKRYLHRQEKLRLAVQAKKEAFAREKKKGNYAIDLFTKE